VKFNPGAVIPVEKAMLFSLNKACEKQRPVRITYHSANKDEITQRVLHPYKLLEHGGAWYAVGWCCLRNDMRYFALHRIEEYEVLDEQRFEPRSDFDVDAWIERAFQIEQGGSEHAVKVHFKPRAARYIRERKWHYSQKLTEHDDKSCTLEFVTQSLDEAKRWLLMYGSEAYVLEPKALRDMLHEEHMQAARQYEASSAA
jgi:predicted DNA-binding transcriptional regulator YafY